jgi:hypothetical protein
VLREKAGRGAAGGSERMATAACEGNRGRRVTMRRVHRLWVGYPNEGCCGRGRLVPNSQYGSRRTATAGLAAAAAYLRVLPEAQKARATWVCRLETRNVSGESGCRGRLEQGSGEAVPTTGRDRPECRCRGWRTTFRDLHTTGLALSLRGAESEWIEGCGTAEVEPSALHGRRAWDL